MTIRFTSSTQILTHDTYTKMALVGEFLVVGTMGLGLFQAASAPKAEWDVMTSPFMLGPAFLLLAGLAFLIFRRVKTVQNIFQNGVEVPAIITEDPVIHGRNGPKKVRLKVRFEGKTHHVHLAIPKLFPLDLKRGLHLDVLIHPSHPKDVVIPAIFM